MPRLSIASLTFAVADTFAARLPCAVVSDTAEHVAGEVRAYPDVTNSTAGTIGSGSHISVVVTTGGAIRPFRRPHRGADRTR